MFLLLAIILVRCSFMCGGDNNRNGINDKQNNEQNEYVVV